MSQIGREAKTVSGLISDDEIQEQEQTAQPDAGAQFDLSGCLQNTLQLLLRADRT
jgi:hypothetical protein